MSSRLSWPPRTFHSGVIALPSLISPHTLAPELTERQRSMASLVADSSELSNARLVGGQKAAKQMWKRKRGTLLPRSPTGTVCTASYIFDYMHDRFLKLLDPRFPFLKLSPSTAHKVYGSGAVPVAGIMTSWSKLDAGSAIHIVCFSSEHLSSPSRSNARARAPPTQKKDKALLSLYSSG